MTVNLKRPRVGDRCFEASWLKAYGTDPETGESDRDRDVTVSRAFATRDEALA